MVACIVEVKGKGKVHPRTGHEGPEGEQMYSSTLHSTSKLDGGGKSTPIPGRFTPKTLFPLYRRLGGGGRTGLDGCGKSRPHRDSTPGPSTP
jgi:rRNA maturation protein Nop10